MKIAAVLTALTVTASAAHAASIRPAALPQAAEVVAHRAAVLHLGNGTHVENGVLLISAGKVTAAGSNVAIPDGARVVEHDGHLSPGLVAASASMLAPGEGRERTRAFLEDLRLVYGFDVAAEDTANALAAGITTVQLTGDNRNVAAGRTAVVKTAAPGGTSNTLVTDGALALSINSQSANNDRPPTSYSGLAQQLNARFDAGEGVWSEVAAGTRPVVVHVRDRHDVLRSVELLAPRGAKGALLGAQLIGEVLDVVQDSGMSVIAAPLGPGASSRAVDSLVALSTSGVPFGFALGEVNSFRFAAAKAARAGGDAAALRRALFSGGATLAGVDNRVGLLSAGHDADFVAWSGDPLDLTSRVRAVHVDGELVYDADNNSDSMGSR